MERKPKTRQSTTRSVSQLKLDLQTVIKNIRNLESMLETGSSSTTSNTNELKQQTSALLSQLEQTPMRTVTNRIEKRRRNRKKLRQKRKQQRHSKLSASTKEPRLLSTAPSLPTKPQQTIAVAASHINESIIAKNALSAPTIKPHQRLRRHHDAQRFLRTFELLKILHAARREGETVTDTKQFATRFDGLRSIWNRVLQENASQSTQASKIEDQWNEALFGANEKMYYGSQQRISDFIRIRRTWDSYLTHSNKHGSSIPIGWVLSPMMPNEQWQKYRSCN